MTTVAIVGSGAAALAAAIAAADEGARVTVFEKTGYFGGTTAVSGGGVWIPGHHHMSEPDSRADALEYCLALGADPDLIETFLHEGPPTLRWLEESTALRFRTVGWPDYHPEMAGARDGRMLEPDLYPRGPAAEHLRPAPVLGLPMTMRESTVEWRPSYTPARYDAAAVKQRVADGLVACGQALVAGLLDAAAERGVDMRRDAPVTRLRTADGRVVGVDDQIVDAVVLATGGFEWDDDLKARFLGLPLTDPATPPANEGDGLVMAMEVGAGLGNMTQAWWYPAASVPGETYEGRPLARFVATERSAPHTIIVNRFGHRFVNEAANYNDMQKSFWHFDANEYANRNLPAWVVFDRQYRERYPVLTTRPSQPDPVWLARGDTPAELARAAGIDPDGLAQTLVRWNRHVAAGRDEDFGRGNSAYDRFHGDPTAPHPTLGTIESAPFYALSLQAGSVGTKGGPRTNSRAEVLNAHGQVIPGLYAAGNVIASPAGPAYFGGGTSLGLALVWGRLAGVNAAGGGR